MAAQTDGGVNVPNWNVTSRPKITERCDNCQHWRQSEAKAVMREGIGMCYWALEQGFAPENAVSFAWSRCEHFKARGHV